MVVCGLDFGIVAAAEFFAEAAIGAGPELHAERIGVGPRHVGGRAGERLVPGLLGRLAEQCRPVDHVERRIGIVARPRALERIAAGLDLALEIAGLAADAAEILELVVDRARARHR